MKRAVVVSRPQVEAFLILFNSVVGDGTSMPRRFRPAQEAIDRFTRKAREGSQGDETAFELRLPLEDWARLIALVQETKYTVLPGTMETIEPVLERALGLLEEHGVQPSLETKAEDEHSGRFVGQSTIPRLGGKERPAFEAWLVEPSPQRRGTVVGPGTQQVIRNHRGIEDAFVEAVYLHDVGKVLVREGVQEENRSEILLGLKCLVRLELTLAEEDLRGGRPRPSFRQTLLHLSTDLTTDSTPWPGEAMFESLRCLAKRLKAIGHVQAGRELEQMVFPLAREWFHRLPEGIAGQEEVREALMVPRKVLLEALKRDWKDLDRGARVERIAKAFVFPFTHQGLQDAQNLTDSKGKVFIGPDGLIVADWDEQILIEWEEHLFSQVAGWRGRDQLRLETVVDIYKRSEELIDDDAWRQFIRSIFCDRWGKGASG